MQIVLASGNKGKIEELQALLSSLNLSSSPQADYGVLEVEETGLSFIENAILKARHVCQHTGLPAIADDSGLCVDALGGEPGIYSARYAGPCANDEANIQKLLHSIRQVPEKQRLATFHCTLVYMSHASDPTPLVCQGEWHGFITEAPIGQKGFGYDPIFWVPQRKKTAAELPSSVKNRLSHRGQAFDMLKCELPKKLLSHFK